MSIFRHNPEDIDIAKLNLEKRPQSPQELAQEIMGTENVFSPEDAETHFGLTPTEEDRKLLETIPFSEQELKECKDTHILTAILPISILDLYEKLSQKYPGTQFFFDTDWPESEPFAKDPGVAHWALIRKTEIPDSTKKTWDEEQKLLTEHDDVPEARDLIYSIFAHFKGTGERIFPSVWVRTKTITSHDKRICVGGFAADGLFGSYRADGDHRALIGLSSFRKPSGKKLEVPVAKQEPVPEGRKF